MVQILDTIMHTRHACTWENPNMGPTENRFGELGSLVKYY